MIASEPADETRGSAPGTRSVSGCVRVSAGMRGESRFTLDAGKHGHERAMQRFAEETALLAQARHPHLLRNVAAAGRTVRVGEALTAFALSTTTQLANLPLHRRLRLFAQLASAVGALHRSGLVHGVLHPDRCGLRPNGDLVLLDLGLVWHDDAGRDGGDDLSYCAPECRAGLLADARADIYSLGLLLYVFLAATPLPRRGAPSFADELVALQPLLDATLSATPTQRPGSVTMLLDRLNAAIMRAPALADRFERERQIEEMPVERVIAVLSMQSQNAAFGTAVPATVQQGSARWQTVARRSRGSVAVRLGLAALVVAAAITYGVRSRAPAELGLVESLGRTAQTQLDAGRLLLPLDDNALDTLRTLRGVDPNGAATEALAQRIRAQAPAAVERAIAAEALDEADAALSRALRAFPDDAALAALSDRMAAARRESSEREQRRDLLARLDAALAEDAGADAAADAKLYELMDKATALGAGDVAERRVRVEKRTAERARAALARDDLAAAQSAIDRLHEAFPASSELAALDADYRRRTGESRQLESARLLRDAAAAEQGHPSDPDALARALDAYLAALRLVPDDATAKESAVRTARSALARAADAVAADDWSGGQRWLALARRVLPAAETASLDARIVRHGRDETAAREALIARAELAVRRGRYFGADDDNAIALYRQSGDAASPQRREGVARVRDAALKDADALIAQRRYHEAAALVEAALANLGSDADFGRRKLTLASLQARPASDAAPDAVAGAHGTLSINAIPWARVHSVTSLKDGRAIALDGDATTPLRLSLPAGDYAVVLGDPAGAATRKTAVTVAAGGSASINVNLRDAPPDAAEARSEQ